MTDNQLPGWVTHMLKQFGIYNPDPTDEFHYAVVDAIINAGSNCEIGGAAVAIRFAVVPVLSDSVRASVEAETELERAKAAAFAEGLDEHGTAQKATGLKYQHESVVSAGLRLAVCKGREMFLRQFVTSLDARLSHWQTQQRTEYRADMAAPGGL